LQRAQQLVDEGVFPKALSVHEHKTDCQVSENGIPAGQTAKPPELIFQSPFAET
jgi:hypothetical protein